MADGTDTTLVTIPKADALSVFTTAGAIDPILAQIRQRIDAFVPDISTAAGRNEVKSFAYTVTRSKTYLDGVGKELADEQKDIPRKIDATRKKLRDTLDAWKDEVRKPLTEWEAAEDARIARIKGDLAALQNFIDDKTERPSATIREALSGLTASPVSGEHYAEYVDAAIELKAKAVAALEDRLAAAMKRETDAAELAKLRAEAAERSRIEQEAKAAQEAKERAAREAQEAAERDRRITEQAIAAEKAKAEAAERAAKEAAERKEREHKAAIEAMERKAVEAAAKAKADAEQAKLREDAERARREADRKHKAKIHRGALAAFVEGGLTEELAKQVVTLIAAGNIPAITINY